MKRIVLGFAGGPWDGRTLRTDSADGEEMLLATACYETSHHGAIGEECVGLLADEETFARRHAWPGATEGVMREDHHYVVSERCETETEIIIRFKHRAMGTQ